MTRSDDSLPVSVFLEVLCATHLSSYVLSPFRDRGGLFLVGPPGAWKSTACELVENSYQDALSLSDINAQGLNRLKPRITAGSVRTLVLPEYSKLYERNADTASNVEGTLRAFVAEGFRSASYDDPTIARLQARTTLLGAMTPEFRDKHAQRWQDSGYARRFLWALVQLEDPTVFDRAVERWELVDVKVSHVPHVPSGGHIPNLTTRRERQALAHLVKYQPFPHSAQLQLLAKILAVLKWWRVQRGQKPGDAFKTVQLFSRALGKHGAQLVL